MCLILPEVTTRRNNLITVRRTQSIQEETPTPILKVSHCPLWTDRPVVGSQKKLLPALDSNLLWECNKGRFYKKNHFLNKIIELRSALF